MSARDARRAWTLPIAAVALLATFDAARVHAGPEGSVLHVESAPSGDLVLEAREAMLAQVLRSIAAVEGFDVLMDERIARRPVNVSGSQGSVEHVLRQILRGRNYALVYDEDTASLAQVIVLQPSTPRRPSAPHRNRRRTSSRER